MAGRPGPPAAGATLMHGAGVQPPGFNCLHFLVGVPDAAAGEALAATVDSIVAQGEGAWRLTVVAAFPCPDPAWGEAGVGWLAPESLPDWAAALPGGDWVLPLPAGIHLLPDCCSLLRRYLAAHPGWRVAYPDEAYRDAQGRIEVEYKPDINPAWLRREAYFGTLFVRADLFREVLPALPSRDTGGFARCDRLWRYRLARLCLQRAGAGRGEVYGHLPVPLVLLPDSERRLSSEALASVTGPDGRPALCETGLRPGTLHRLPTPSTPPGVWPRVSVIIPDRDQPDLLAACLDSLARLTDYPQWEVILVDNGSRDPATLALYERYELASGAASGAGRAFRRVPHPGPFNFAELCNLGAEAATGEVLLFLNNDTEIIEPGWLQEMVGLLAEPDESGGDGRVGIVGARLLFPGPAGQRRLQHGGMILGAWGSTAHPFEGLGEGEPGYMGRTQVVQDYSAVTGAALLIRADLYRQLGGMDATAFPHYYNDVDLCLRAREAGWRVLWTPHATLLHVAGASLKALEGEQCRRDQAEAQVFIRRWLSRLGHDPAYHPRLSLMGELFLRDDTLLFEPESGDDPPSAWTTLLYLHGGERFPDTLPTRESLLAQTRQAGVALAGGPLRVAHALRPLTVPEVLRLAPAVILLEPDAAGLMQQAWLGYEACLPGVPKLWVKATDCGSGGISGWPGG